MIDDAAVPHRSLHPFAAFMTLSLILAWAVLVAVSSHAESSPAQNRTDHVIRAWIALQRPPTAAPSVITARRCPEFQAVGSFAPQRCAAAYDIPGMC
ncbi:MULTISPECIES: hypothetical protein [Streptomyces]|uniref:hypothetical protein n=1 Tax=Streptomyces TaxID=1883 RepID=UPI00114CD788|nr:MULTISPECIES: hypothetical protein [unclassified Streptomyces]MYT17788.1 hypothetical protein [Streptomyces sp. SID4951]